MAEHNETGTWGEDKAQTFLVDQGYHLIDRDWHYGKRDIDIIALSPDEREIVFVEVKTRESDDIVDPAAAVTLTKMRSIGLCAHVYIKQNNIVLEPRFDVITITGKTDADARIEHHRDAFNPCLL